MRMLLLIGLGLDSKDISVRALEELKRSDVIFLEEYTTFISQEYLEYLKKESGREIRVLGRSDLEEYARETMKDAATKRVALLVPGDPLIATTHHSTLLNEARKMGIDYSICHAASIYSAAVGESGLDIYRFGPPVTIAFWSEKYKPTSFLDAIRKNYENGHHTLVLLDLEQKARKTMGIEEAVKLLEEAEKAKEYGLIDDDLQVLAMGDVGKKTQEMAYFRIGDLGKVAGRFKGKVLVLVIPSSPSFAEEESLNKYAVH